jgi:hypothetical protein
VIFDKTSFPGLSTKNQTAQTPTPLALRDIWDALDKDSSEEELSDDEEDEDDGLKAFRFSS